MTDTPQVNLIAVVGAGGAIGPAAARPQFMYEEEANLYQQWFLDLTRHGIIVMGHRSMDLLYAAGFKGIGQDWMIVGWTRDATYDPDEFIGLLQEANKPIFICGGHNTFQTFMPYVTQFFIRRVALKPPHDLYMPPLFGRTQ